MVLVRRGERVLFHRARSIGRDRHGAVREEGDTRLASQISRINPSDRWECSAVKYDNEVSSPTNEKPLTPFIKSRRLKFFLDVFCWDVEKDSVLF
uniref:Uncharacterized protein n=1 Tax=Knipowitschia caucasica TaxID=637954 RepID=A0AAV2JKC5_KNICA